MLQREMERIFSQQNDLTVADMFERARTRMGLTLTELAGQLQVNKSALSRFERGVNRGLGTDKIIEACSILGLDAYEVFFKIGELHPDMEAKILSDWTLCDELRKALHL